MNMAGDNRSPLAPTALPPSQQSSVYEVKMAPDAPGGRGQLRFEEGLATDQYIPQSLVQGMQDGYVTDSRGHNRNVYEKPAAETMGQRVHAGSAAWTESPTYLGAFAGGSGSEAEQCYVQVTNPGTRQQRRNAAQVND